MLKVFSAAAVLACAAVATTATLAPAATVDITGGRTSVAVDVETLGSAAGLSLSGTSADVQSPGDLPNSVAFPINARDAAVRPTTFSYDPADFLGTFAGTIEHEGTVLFNDGAVEVGDFTIGYDASRAGTINGLASGFYVQSNTGVNAILFDVGTPGALDATETALTIDADLLVSPEFGQFLLGGGLAASDLAGADVGDARVAAIGQLSGGGGGGGGTPIPLPPAVLPGLVALAMFVGPKLLNRKLA